MVSYYWLNAHGKALILGEQFERVNKAFSKQKEMLALPQGAVRRFLSGSFARTTQVQKESETY